MRKLKVAPEYGTGSIWDDDWDGQRDICPTPASLGASDDLQAAFEEWEQAWDATYVDDGCSLAGGRFATNDARAAFNRTGEELTARLQAELGPDTVVRFVPMGLDSVHRGIPG